MGVFGDPQGFKAARLGLAGQFVDADAVLCGRCIDADFHTQSPCGDRSALGNCCYMGAAWAQLASRCTTARIILGYGARTQVKELFMAMFLRLQWL